MEQNNSAIGLSDACGIIFIINHLRAQLPNHYVQTFFDQKLKHSEDDSIKNRNNKKCNFTIEMWKLFISF